jgi:hypothetical protein
VFLVQSARASEGSLLCCEVPWYVVMLVPKVERSTSVPVVLQYVAGVGRHIALLKSCVQCRNEGLVVSGVFAVTVTKSRG